MKSAIKPNGDQRKDIIPHEQLDNAERDCGLKLSNNSLANQYLPYYEGEQTDYDVRQVHMNQNVSDWNSNETIFGDAKNFLDTS